MTALFVCIWAGGFAVAALQVLQEASMLSVERRDIGFRLLMALIWPLYFAIVIGVLAHEEWELRRQRRGAGTGGKGT